MKVYRPTYQDRSGKTVESDNYFVRHRGKRYPLKVTEKRIAEIKARELIAQLELGHNPRLIDKSRQELMTVLFDEFHDSINPRKSERHRHLHRLRLVKLANGIKAKSLSQFDAAKVGKWVHEAKIAARTKQHYLRAVQQFGAWLTRTNRVARNPFLEIQPVTGIEADRKLRRRALSEVEITTLLASVVHSKRRRCFLRGADRAMLYKFVLSTGLRRDEIASLTPESFLLDAAPPHVVVDASITKNGKLALQPIPASLVVELRPYLEDMRPGRSVWPIRGGLTSKMLKDDLNEAGVAVARNGLVVDFHALRTTFGTKLALANVPLALGMRLMRHSDPKLTAVTYAVAQLSDLSREIEKL